MNNYLYRPILNYTILLIDSLTLMPRSTKLLHSEQSETKAFLLTGIALHTFS